MTKLTIKKWPEEDRPREKMLKKGPAVLSDAELIAILIGSGNQTESAVQLSQRILHSVKENLHTLGKLSIKDLSDNFKGIGEAKAITILAAMELGKRHGCSEVEKLKKITSSKEVFHVFYPLVGDLSHEELWIALLNRAGKIVEKKKISQGGISGTAADVQIILKAAINQLTSGIILCHNHPSGNLQPSQQDDKLTERLQDAARLIDIKLLDHLIIGNNQYYSYADEGRIL